MAEKKLLIRNNEYYDVRLNIFGDENGNEAQYYTEARGDRHYFNIVATQSDRLLENASFNSFLSFTMSADSFAQLGDSYHVYDIVPMSPGEVCMVETCVSAFSSDGTKGYVMKSFGGFKCNSSSLSLIDDNITYDIKTDFQTFGCFYMNNGTQSIQLHFSPDTREVVDVNVYIRYSKAFHTLLTLTQSGGDIYPGYPGGATAS